MRDLAKGKVRQELVQDQSPALLTPILGRTEEEAQAKLKKYRRYAPHEGALALFCGWAGIELNQYGEDEELRQMDSNAVKSTIAGYARFSLAKLKWTRDAVAEHISIGGNGQVIVEHHSRLQMGSKHGSRKQM